MWVVAYRHLLISMCLGNMRRKPRVTRQNPTLVKSYCALKIEIPDGYFRHILLF